jgi:hypothetical protein
MRTTLAGIVALVLLAGASASADLTLIGTSTYELVREAEQPAPDGEQPDDEELMGMSLPEMLVMENDLSWSKMWMTQSAWRVDFFEQDPRTGASPILSSIRLEDSGRLIQLDWEERTAEIIDDPALETREQQMDEQEEQAQADFEQNRADLLEQLPPEVLEQMPPEVLAQIQQILAGEQGDEFGGEWEGPQPAVTVSIEGPLGEETVLGHACAQYRITTEVGNADDDGPWGHMRELAVVSLTSAIDPPLTTGSPWEWRGATIISGMPDQWERAAEGLNVPDGFAMKMHTTIEDLDAGSSGVLTAEIIEYNEDTIASSVFEIPAGFTVEQMDIPQIGQPEQVQP